VEHSNTLDPETPCGIVGGQAPNAFGGFDYAKLTRKVQFIRPLARVGYKNVPDSKTGVLRTQSSLCECEARHGGTPSAEEFILLDSCKRSNALKPIISALRKQLFARSIRIMRLLRSPVSFINRQRTTFGRSGIISRTAIEGISAGSKIGSTVTSRVHGTPPLRRIN